jgi:hypothetical protein
LEEIQLASLKAHPEEVAQSQLQFLESCSWQYPTQIPAEASVTRLLTFLCLGCGGNLALQAAGQIHQAFSLWADQDAVLANFVGEPLPGLELESLAHGGWNSSLAPVSNCRFQ